MALELVQKLPEMIGNAVEANPLAGYGAIFVAMFLENLFPPIPSELIMPLGGFYVRSGQLALVPVVLAGLLGTVLGALPWYGIGRLVNEERIEQWLARHGRWIGISPQELHRSRDWFNRHGTALVFWGRLIPGIRTLISMPAGYALGEAYVNVETWLEPVAKVIKVLLVLSVLGFTAWLALRTWKKRQDSH